MQSWRMVRGGCGPVDWMRIDEVEKKRFKVKKYEGKFPVQCTHVRKKLYNVHYHNVWYKWSVEKSKKVLNVTFYPWQNQKELARFLSLPTKNWFISVNLKKEKKLIITKMVLASQSKQRIFMRRWEREEKENQKLRIFKPRCVFFCLVVVNCRSF